MISALENHVLEDRLVTLHGAEPFRISGGTYQEILTSDLGMQIICTSAVATRIRVLG